MALSRPGETLPAEAIQPADDVFALAQIGRVELAHGIELGDPQRAEILRFVLGRGYSRLALERAATDLVGDVELARSIRFAKGERVPLSAADFSRRIEGDPERPGSALGDGLLTHAGMLAEAQRLSLYPVTQHFRAVPVEGEDRPRWTRI